VTFQANNNATFGNTGVGTVTVDAGGVAPNNVIISNTTGTYTFNGGSINAAGTLTKSGAGTAVFNVNNQFTGTTFAAGTIQTNAVTALGSGPMTVTGTSTALVTTSDLTLSGGITSTGAITKSGAGKLFVAGTPGNAGGGTVTISAGNTVQMLSAQSLGGVGTTAGLVGAMALVLNNGATLETNYGSTNARFGGSITLNNATITRLNLSPDNDSALETYSGVNNFGGVMTVYDTVDLHLARKPFDTIPTNQGRTE
jgi:autotransporter-associated beta strand protein